MTRRRRLHHPSDVGRRVIGCRRCGHHETWTGEAAAFRAGWTAIPGPKAGQRSWECAGCRVDAPDAPVGRVTRVRVASTLEGLEALDPARFRVVLAAALAQAAAAGAWPHGLRALARARFSRALEDGDPVAHALVALGLTATWGAAARRSAAARRAVRTRAERTPCPTCSAAAGLPCKGAAPCPARVRTGLKQRSLFRSTTAPAA